MSGERGRAERRARWVVFGAVVLTAVLYLVPYGRLIAYPLVLLSTYAHEMGHGVAGLMAGASFEKFEMYLDGSGVATVSGNISRLGAGLVSAGGLVGPAVLGGLFFAASGKARLARALLLVFGAAMLLSCVLVVRSMFGVAFVALVGAMCGLIGWRGSPLMGQASLAFLATQLALSVFSRGDYLFTEFANIAGGDMRHPSDVANMAEALFLPYWFWGALCGVFSVVVLGAGLWIFWRTTRVAQTPLEARLDAAKGVG